MYSLTQEEINKLVADVKSKKFVERIEIADNIERSLAGYILANIKVDDKVFQGLIDSNMDHVNGVGAQIAENIRSDKKKLKITIGDLRCSNLNNLVFQLNVRNDELNVSWKLDSI